MKSILCDLCVSSEAGERKKSLSHAKAQRTQRQNKIKNLISRRDAERAEKKADLGFYSEMFFPLCDLCVSSEAGERKKPLSLAEAQRSQGQSPTNK